MGGRYSTLAPPNKSTSLADNILLCNHQTDDANHHDDIDDAYFALALHEPDRICLIHAGSDVIGIIQKSIRTCVGGGSGENESSSSIVQKEQKCDDGSYEFQFKGHPFSKFAGRLSALKIKRILCQLVADLYANGWDLEVASDLTTDDYHTTWFFRRRSIDGPTTGQTGGSSRLRTKRRIVSLSLSGSDGLTLVNAPERLRKALIDAVRFGYSYGSESEDVFEDDLEIKLNGGPWETGMLEEGIWARKLLLEIFRQFAKCRYTYYAVADTKGTADSIFFIHQQQPQETVESAAEVPQLDPQSISTNPPREISTEIHSPIDISIASTEPSQMNSVQAGQLSVHSPRSSMLLGVTIQTERRRSDCGLGDDQKPQIIRPGSPKRDFLDVTVQARRNSWQEQSPTSSSTTIQQSLPFEPNLPFHMEQFLMVSLNRADSLRLIDAPKSIRDLAKDCIVSHWPYGLQRETKYDMAYELRMGKSPWAAVGGDAIRARAFLTALFERMLAEGWRLLATLDISRRKNDKSVFVIKKDPVFARKPAPAPPLQSKVHPHFCLSMTDGDKLRIIRGDPHVIRTVSRVVKDHWPYGIQREREFFDSYEIQMIGHPWLSLPGGGNEPLAARVMLLEMLRVFHARKWRVIVSADVSGRYQTPANLLYNPVSVDSWIVVKEEEEEVEEGDKAFTIDTQAIQIS